MAHQPNDKGSFFALTRHEEYHINGGDLFFLVEHVQFRVHRYFFERESGVFRNQLTTPASPGATRQGSSESNAIVLENVKSVDFAKFLWVFYNPKYSLYNATTEDWTVIINLAHRWAFPEVKSLAVRELEKLVLSDVDRISIYHTYQIDKSLLIPRYAALCERENPLTLQEGLQLGMETTLMIARLRELSRANPTPSGARSPRPAGIHFDEMTRLVCEMFEVQLPATARSDQNGTTTPPATAPPTPDPSVKGNATDEEQKPHTGGPSDKPDGETSATTTKNTGDTDKTEGQTGTASGLGGTIDPDKGKNKVRSRGGK